VDTRIRGHDEVLKKNSPKILSGEWLSEAKTATSVAARSEPRPGWAGRRCGRAASSLFQANRRLGKRGM